MNLSTKIAYNTIVQFASKLVSTILGLIAVAILTRYLGQTGYGEYTTIITFLSFFAILADFGLTLITTQMISRPGVNEEKILNNIFTFRLFSAFVLLGLAPVVVLFFPYNPIIKLGVSIAAMSFIFIALNQVFIGLFQKKLRMDKSSIADVFARIILLIGVIIAFKYDFGLTGIMLAVVFSSLINFLIHYYFAAKFVKVKFEFDFIVWRQIFTLCWPLAITIALNLIYLKADTLILSLIKTQAEVGIYGAAYKVIEVLVTVPFMFAGIVMPILTLSWAEKNYQKFKNVLQRSFDFMAILIVPCVIGAFCLSDNVMVLVAGSDFKASGQVLEYLIIASGFIFLGCILSHAIIVFEKQKQIIGAYVFTSITSLIGYLYFIPKYSYFGAAWVTIYSEATIALAAGYYVWKFSRFIPKLNILIKALISALIMAGFFLISPKNFYSNGLKLIAFIFSLSMIYFLSLYLIRGITKKDILSLLNR